MCGGFALIKPVDPNARDGVDAIADWKATPGTVAIRVMMGRDVARDGADPGINRVLATAARHGFPVNLMCVGRLAQVAELARRNPDTRLVIDHLGFRQPFEPPPPAEPFAQLPMLLELAQYDNVAVKVSGACTLSLAPFPFPDIWEPLARVFEAFGFDRCMWGTDWTRAIALLTYQQGVEAFRIADRLSEDERAALMGGTLQRIYDWKPSL